MKEIALMCGLSLTVGSFFYEKKQSYKYHIVSILDESPEKQIVFKFFGKHKQRWHYEIKSLYEVNMWFQCGLYYLKGICVES